MAKTAKVDISTEGDATVFTVTPGGARRQPSMMIGGATFILVGWMFRNSLGPMLFWMRAGLGALILLLLARKMTYTRG